MKKIIALNEASQATSKGKMATFRDLEPSICDIETIMDMLMQAYFHPHDLDKKSEDKVIFLLGLMSDKTRDLKADYYGAYRTWKKDKTCV